MNILTVLTVLGGLLTFIWYVTNIEVFILFLMLVTMYLWRVKPE